MAFINRDNFFNGLESGAKWNAGVAFNRTNPIPIDANSVFKTKSDAENYVTNNPVAYPGQILAVVDSNKTEFYGINHAGQLQSLGGNTSPMLFVADQETMLSIEQEISAGQQVYREDTHTVWIFKGGNKAEIGNWVESASHNDVVWNGTKDKVTFHALDQSTFDSIRDKNANTIYFVTDSGKVYKGNVNVTDSIIVSEAIPEVGQAVKNKLYINRTSLEAKITVDGSSYIDLSPGYITDGGNWAQTNNDAKIGTIKVIKQVITQALKTITFDNSYGTIKFGQTASAVLNGVAHNPNYDADKLKLTIPVYGGEAVVVDIPKDKFVKAGKYYENYPEEEPTHHKVIVLEVESGEPVIIPADALVKTLTTDNTSKNIILSISDNKISASLTIDPVEGNGLTYSEAGFKVDLSSKVNNYSAGNASELLLSDAEGKTLNRSGKTILSGDANLGNDDNTLATAKVIAKAISDAISKVKPGLEGSPEDEGKILIVDETGKVISIGNAKLSDLATKSEISNKIDKVVGTESNLVLFGAEGAIKDSNKSIGGATLSGTKDENKLATESAVENALSWKSLE